MEKDSDEWISILEGLKIEMSEFGRKGGIKVDHFSSHTQNNLHKELGIIFDGLENLLKMIGLNVILVVIWDMLKYLYKNYK